MSPEEFETTYKIVSAGATMLAAVAGLIVAIFVALGYFRSLPVQKSEKESALKIVSSEEAEEPNDYLEIYQTEYQRTLLKATSRGLECWLFDNRSGKPKGLQWILDKEDALAILNSKDFNVNEGHKPKTGTIRIGLHRKWIYSKSMFPDKKVLENNIISLLHKTAS